MYAPVSTCLRKESVAKGALTGSSWMSIVPVRFPLSRHVGDGHVDVGGRLDGARSLEVLHRLEASCEGHGRQEDHEQDGAHDPHA